MCVCMYVPNDFLENRSNDFDGNYKIGVFWSRYRSFVILFLENPIFGEKIIFLEYRVYILCQCTLSVMPLYLECNNSKWSCHTATQRAAFT